MKNTVRTAGRVEHTILGAKLRQLREKAGLSKAELQRRLGKGHPYLTRIESGQRFIDFATLLDIIHITGASFADVMRDVEAEINAHYEAAKTPPES